MRLYNLVQWLIDKRGAVLQVTVIFLGRLFAVAGRCIVPFVEYGVLAQFGGIRGVVYPRQMCRFVYCSKRNADKLDKVYGKIGQDRVKEHTRMTWHVIDMPV